MFNTVDRQILERDVARTRATGAELHFTPIRVLDAMIEALEQQEKRIEELDVMRAAKAEIARLRKALEKTTDALIYGFASGGAYVDAVAAGKSALGKEESCPKN